ncbi:RNA polymerase sigma factor [Mangrovibacterium diazotrophicum]|uniref:RNA polymerase sigma-70 factor (ECF subfamily) n=1 Tax=Mangrovibacterium diazotrophicum TaxID=1261403 RepID=A0A419VUV8_9BACT|nr:RNA polymerase sigma-70 factor [Mangrovibacterium diazotrophicum]RKD85133.1 RNA polymerase sigma-70 factor (ECF subfamily) [Mangrovibacterium diazotrophicum]
MPQPNFQSDQFLLDSLQDGQEKAFDYIFRKYFKGLCAQANLYVHDLDHAQNIVQECFVKMWENRKDATKIANLSGYLSFMVRNRSIDHVRKFKRELVVESVGEDVGMTDSSDAVLLSHEFEEKLVEALSMLPERCRVAFEYSRFEGLTYGEISQKMGISVKGVEALMSRSLKILRGELKDYLPLLLLFLT